ncbi:MAG: stage II sporulation protein R [Clostridiales bacterium]
MKKFLALLLISTTVFSLSIWLYSNNATAEQSLIRFHVIANSDAPYDQEVKLKVRDAVLKAFAHDLNCCKNYQEAYDLLTQNSNKIEKIANETLLSNGFTYGAKVQIKKDIFPTKKYGDLTLGAGEYQAVKILLGAGEGKNWWCVMFPPLCFVDISQNIGVAHLESYNPQNSDEIVAADAKITEVKIKSKIHELLK